MLVARDELVKFIPWTEAQYGTKISFTCTQARNQNMRLRRSQNAKNQQQQALYHYLDQKGLLQYSYCLAYQYLIIAAALPPIAARCAKPGTQPEIRN
jgi:hypothetical protein